MFFLGAKAMLKMLIKAMLLIGTFFLTEQIAAQGVTFLIKGKVVDGQRKALQGVQVFAKENQRRL
jgi:hypothetical protein